MFMLRCFFERLILLSVFVFCTSVIIEKFELASSSFISIAVAQDKSKKTKRTPTLRMATYDKLGKAAAFLEEEKYDKALNVLAAMKKDESLNSYEKAKMWEFYAAIYISQENYNKALQAHQTVLKQEAIPEALEISTTYAIAQLYLQLGDYQKSIYNLKKWFAIVENPGPNAYAVMGQAYYQLENYKSAAQQIEKAISVAKQRALSEDDDSSDTSKPKEQWLLILRASYFELNNIRKVTDVLEDLVLSYPKGDYFSQLSAMYAEQKQQKKQLHILEVGYDGGYLTKGGDLVALASLLLHSDVPFKAAKILDKGIKKKQVKTTVSNLKLLAQAWYLAQESEKSIEVYTQAAKKADEGDIYIRLSKAYAELDRWPEAVKAANSGIKKGGLKKKADAYLTLGNAYFNSDKLESAMKAFRSALRNAEKHSKERDYASNWIRYLEKEIYRRKQLEDFS